MKRRKQSMDSDLSSTRGFFRARLSHLESQSLGGIALGGITGGTCTDLIGGNPVVLSSTNIGEEDKKSDLMNYALLIVLYALQGIPMGLSASIPFLIQQKVQAVLMAGGSSTGHDDHLGSSSISRSDVGTTSHEHHTSASSSVYNANAIFALCSWPFSLKLLWAPIVDACYLRRFGRRKSWLVPVQMCAGMLMVVGSNFVETQLGISALSSPMTATTNNTTNVTGLTAFFFALYFLMATQDIAVDGWALTMLSKRNRGRGPVCNSIGQNIGYFISFVGFLALNDAESCETLWRPLLRLSSQPGMGLISLGGFLRSMGYFMLATTTFVALFKREVKTKTSTKKVDDRIMNQTKNDDDDEELRDLDASELGLKETYHRLWAVCKLPSVQWLFVVLLTYRFPTSLTDNVKFLKAVEYGLSKSSTALLSPTVILPLGILVPIVATRIWHSAPLQQFMNAYKFRVTIVPLLDVLMLIALRQSRPTTVGGLIMFWTLIVASTAAQAIANSMQFNAQMTFFAKRVDPAIGGSYMTLLNTAANLGGTWPASFVMWLVGTLSKGREADCDGCPPQQDPYFAIQGILSLLGCLWIVIMSRTVHQLEHLPDDAWRTHLEDEQLSHLLSSVDVLVDDASIVYDKSSKQ